MQYPNHSTRRYIPASQIGTSMLIGSIQLLFFATLLCILPLESFGQKNKFLRLYNAEGKKMAAGRLLSVSDSGMVLQTRKGPKTFEATEINFIRHRRSIGHNVLVTGLALGAAGTLIGTASADPDASFLAYTAGEGAAVGFAAGFWSGAVFGGLIGLAKKKTIHHVRNSAEEWRKLKIFYEDWLKDNE